MNQYQLQNAVFKIDGYWQPSPSEECLGHVEMAFDRAREDCLGHLANQMEHVKSITFQQFMAETKRTVRQTVNP